MTLIDVLILHEGSKSFVYQDSKGFWTIGVGRNVDPSSHTGLSPSEITLLLENDINRCKRELSSFDFYENLDVVRKEVLIELCFNMGLSTLMQFKKMIAALKKNDFNQAAKELENSRWATQVSKRRVSNIIKRLITGSYDDRRGCNSNTSGSLD